MQKDFLIIMYQLIHKNNKEKQIKKNLIYIRYLLTKLPMKLCKILFQRLSAVFKIYNDIFLFCISYTL